MKVDDGMIAAIKGRLIIDTGISNRIECSVGRHGNTICQLYSGRNIFVVPLHHAREPLKLYGSGYSADTLLHSGIIGDCAVVGQVQRMLYKALDSSNQSAVVGHGAIQPQDPFHCQCGSRPHRHSADRCSLWHHIGWLRRNRFSK